MSEGTDLVGLTCTQTVARDLVRTVSEALDDLPDDVDRLLGSRNVDVRVCQRWTEIWPDWDPTESTSPRGYGEGATWAECTGYYSSDIRRVYVQRDMWEDGEWTPDIGGAPATVWHELGHAFDYTSTPRLARSEPFKVAYLDARDAAKQHDELAYYVQHWASGILEAWATAFVFALDGPSLDEDELFPGVFGRCVDAAAELIEKEADDLRR